MEVVFLPQADNDLSFLVKTGNKPILKKIAKLTQAILENPYTGVGKPEALKNLILLANGLVELTKNTVTFIKLKTISSKYIP
jgi:hypothetical protein